MIIPFFRVGTHTDSAGNTTTYTPEELDRRVSLYNDQIERSAHEATIVVGHPKTDAPAFGWVRRLFRQGELVYAEADQVDETFGNLFRAGRYKKVSASWYNTGMLRHIGFLGATPPAIKGLPVATFAEGEETVVEFSAGELGIWRYQWDHLLRILRRFREYLIESKDIETADKIVAPWELEGMEPPPDVIPNDNLFSQLTPERTMPPDPEFQQRLTALEAENAQLKTQIETAAAERARRETEQRRSEFAQFCESEEMRTRITPAIRPIVDGLFELVGTGSHEFEEGEGDTKTKVQKTGVEILKNVLRQLAPQVDFTERAKNGVAPEPQPSEAADRIATAANTMTGRKIS
jgi:hypothetical protein